VNDAALVFLVVIIGAPGIVLIGSFVFATAAIRRRR